MSVRLGFSVAIQVEADVLLVDEVLAVGDAAFQQKCFDEFDRMKAENRTILYVTHDMSSVERFCDRGLVLERGRMVAEGVPGARSPRIYNELNFGQMRGGERRTEAGAPCASCAAGVRTRDGERIVSSRQGEEIRACFEVEFHAGRSRTRCSRCSSATRCGTRSSSRTATVTATRAASSAATRAIAPLRLREPARPEPLHVHRARRPARGGARLLRRGRGHLFALIVQAQPHDRRHRRPALRGRGGASDERRRRRPGPATAARRRSATTCAASGA